MFCRLLYTSVTVRGALGNQQRMIERYVDRLTDSIDGRVRAGEVDVFEDINTQRIWLVDLAKFGFTPLSDKNSLSRPNVLDLAEVKVPQSDVFGCQHVVMGSLESFRRPRAEDKGTNAMGISHAKNTAAA